MKVQESAENYLETILILGQAQNTVRSIDIVHKLNFSKPSVSVAMKNLRQKGLIVMDTDGHIALTESGRKIAETIYERHTVLSQMLIDLGVDPEIATQDACRMENVIIPESFNAIKDHIRQKKSGNGQDV